VPLIVRIPLIVDCRMTKKLKTIDGLLRFDDVVAQPFQILVSLLATKQYRLNAIMRDVGCLVVSGWFVTMFAVAISSYSVWQKIAMLLCGLTVLVAEARLLRAHNSLCKIGWSREVSQLYMVSAVRYRTGFLLLRLSALVGFAFLPVLSLLFQSDWGLVDASSYVILFIYIWKFYLERFFPTDEALPGGFRDQAGEAA
jgi:hypothetical protein